MSCVCQRCDQDADCYSVVFRDTEWIHDSNMRLCECCYNRYSSIYTIEIIQDFVYDECEDDPIEPVSYDDDACENPVIII